MKNKVTHNEPKLGRKYEALKKDIIGILLSIVLVYLVSAVFDTGLDLIVFRKNEAMIENYEEINRAITRYDLSKVAFRMYNRNRDESRYIEYLREHEEVIRSLDALADKFKENEITQMNYRILSQMLEHRHGMILDYHTLEINQVSLSEDLSYIFILSDRISSQMNTLMSSYLDVVDVTNNENMLWHRKMQALSNGSLFLILISLIMLSGLTVRRVKSKFHEVTFVVKKIGNRGFSVNDVPRTHYQDVNVFVDTMNEMKGEIRELIGQTEAFAQEKILHKQQKRLLAESRIKQLQLQINPHFLFNTLSIIIRHIQLGENENSIQLIKATSKILRSSLANKTLTISLDEEIELLNSYLLIQQIHLMDRVDIVLDIQKAYGNVILKVPPLIIQPIVENAVMHGMKDITEGGKIDITIVERASYVEVMVKDNGPGISEEMADTLLHGELSEHIGIHNVVQRLKLLYERDDVFSINSEPGQGTRVVMKFFKKEV